MTEKADNAMRKSGSLSFWAGRRVMVTGHAGFKGSWLCLVLQNAGASVGGFGFDPIPGSHFELSGVAAGLEMDVRGDIRDAEALDAAFGQFAPEMVFHLAAQAIVIEGYRDPKTTYSTNVMGTLNVLESSKASGATAVCSVASDKCYENREWPWGYRENDRLGGFDPYSSSKACAEILVDSWRRSYASDGRISVGSARAGNVVGGGDRAPNRLIPDACEAFAREEPLVLRQPHSTRPWQHVLDCLAGYLALGEALLSGKIEARDAFNFGPGQSAVVCVEEAARIAETAWFGASRGCVAVDPDSATVKEAGKLLLDVSKAREVLGIEGMWDAKAAIERTVAWEKIARQAASGCRDESLRQIGERFHSN